MLAGLGRGPPAPGAGRGPPVPAAGRAALCPGAGAPGAGAAPGRGAPGRGATGAELNGLLPTRGALCTGALGPGLGPVGPSTAGGSAGACAPTGAVGVAAETGASVASATTDCGATGSTNRGSTDCAAGDCSTGTASTTGASTTAASGLGPGRGPGRAPLGAALTAPFAGAAGAAAAVGNAPRRRRATGASTVDDADFTNSPCSFSLASTSLLVTPSSFASSCTRALPATALLTGRPGGKIRTTSVYNRRTFITDASRGAHEFSACLPRWTHWVFTGRAPSRAATALASSGPGTFNALGNARRRSAAARQSPSGCNHAPRPGSLRCGSGRTHDPCATTLSSPVVDARRRHPTHVRSG